LTRKREEGENAKRTGVKSRYWPVLFISFIRISRFRLLRAFALKSRFALSRTFALSQFPVGMS